MSRNALFRFPNAHGCDYNISDALYGSIYAVSRSGSCCSHKVPSATSEYQQNTSIYYNARERLLASTTMQEETTGVYYNIRERY